MNNSISKAKINIGKQGNLELNKTYIYRVIKENILLLKLKPGEKISEVKLQKLFNTSRSPIREAIVRLTEETLIEVRPQVGTYISKLDTTFIEESIFMRSAIDKEIMRIACKKESDTEKLLIILKNILEEQKAISTDDMNAESIMEFLYLNEKFHMSIYEYFNKIKIWDNIKIFGNHYQRFHMLESVSKTNVDFAISQHKKTIKAIKEKSFKIAEEIEDNLLVNYKEKIKIIYDKYPEYFKYEMDR